ncbi:MAG: hypothetical protein FJ255_00805 [Phycisphaerae bacterium]|nr:hypothetical protein [Phycisphaerae bacterium]
MNRSNAARLASLGLILACGAAAAAPPRYDVVSIGEASFVASGATSLAFNGWTAGWALTAIGPAIWRRSPEGQVQVLVSGVDADLTSVQGDAGLNIFVNSSGAVAASWRIGAGRVGAIFPASGSAIAITGLVDVDVAGLNDTGHVAASGDLTAINRVGVAGPPAQLLTIPAFGPNGGSRGVQVTGINAAGVVVGGATDPAIPLRPFRAGSAGLTPLPIPSGGLAAIAEGISDDGRVVGRVLAPTNHAVRDWRAVVWTNNVPAVVASLAWTPPAGYYTLPVVKPYRINSQGRAVGTVRYVKPIAGDPSGAPDYADVSQARGFIIDAGRMYDLNGLLAPASGAWRIVSATDIANDGRIVASARQNGVGPERAVLLTPAVTPPPPGQPPRPTTPPPTPAAPTLHHTTDLGLSSTDGVTSSRRLRLVGTAEARAQVRVFIDGVETRHRAFANTRGEYRFDVFNLPEGEHRFAVYAINIIGPSQASPVTSVRVDYTRPVTPVPPTIVAAELAPSPLPGLPATRAQQPTFEGRATPGHQVQLRLGSRLLATAIAAGDGAYTLRPSVPLRIGSVHSLRVYERDVAGNLSRQPALTRFVIVR